MIVLDGEITRKWGFMKTEWTAAQLTGQEKRDGGYTLIEILVTVAIFAVLAAAIQGVLLVGESSWQTNSVRVELVQEIRKAMDRMSDDLRQTGPGAIEEGPKTADGTTYTSIQFQKAIGVQGGSIQWDEVASKARYTEFILDAVNSGHLLKNIEVDDGNNNTNTSVVIAQNIKTLEFSRKGAAPDIIEVVLVAEKNTVKGRVITINFGFDVQMRN